MRPYEIEIFDSDLAYVEHTLTNSMKFKEDYLDPEKNTVTINYENDIEAGYYIRIRRGTDKEHFGCIKEVKRDKEEVKLTYEDYMSKFDQDILIDTDLIGVGTLEAYIAARITETFISNSDTCQNLTGLTVTTSSSTSSWTLDIESDEEDDHYAEVNLFDDIILPAFQNYQVKIDFSVDIMKRKIIADINICTSAELVIEADLPNIISQEITIRKRKKEVNKCYIYNKNNYDRNTIYYLHSDNTYDESDSDRVVPVAFSVETISTKESAYWIEKMQKSLTSAIKEIVSLNDEETLEEDDITALADDVELLNTYLSFGLTQDSTTGYVYDSTSTLVTDSESYITDIDAWVSTEEAETYGENTAQDAFDEKALSKAESVFSKNKYENLIELECIESDTLVNPIDMEIGQTVSVIHNGASYSSILTGREIGDTVTLVFGLLRLELTKILKGRS